MRARFISLILLLLLSNAALAAKRPVVGLALSGGGAKGLAHIGVLKVLEAEGIEIDLIAGSSIGAIIGSLYAAGYTTSEIESLVVHTRWGELFDDTPRHRDLSMEQKLYNERYQISLPIRRRGLGLPTGVMPGQNISMLLEWLLWPVRDVRDFRKLPLPFVCVATDLETGAAITLERGNLVEAVRASFAIPSVFTPVEIDNRLLVDGGVVRNLPAQNARDMGADIVIGVDVAAPLRDRERLDNLVAILNQTLSFQQQIADAAQRELCDLVIQPDISEYTVMDFADAHKLIALGEDAARQQLPALRALVDSVPSDPQRPPRVLPAAADSVQIKRIVVEGLEHTSTRVVMYHLDFSLPQWAGREDLDQGIRRIYSSQFYERVSYQLDPCEVGDGCDLRIKLVERDTDYLRFGARYDSDEHAAALVNATFRNLAMRGSLTAVDAQLGDRSIFRITQFHYTGLVPRIGVRLVLQHRRTELNAVRPGALSFGTRVRDTRATLMLGSIFANTAVLGAGLDRVHTRYVPRGTAETDPQSVVADYHQLFAMLWTETLDRTVFPSRGVYLLARGDYADRDIRTNFQFKKIDARAALHLPFKNRITMGIGGAAGLAEGERQPPDNYFTLGGADDFLGAELEERSGTHKQSGWISLQWEPWPRRVIRLRGNVGNVFESWNDRIDWDRYEKGGGLTVGALTVAGPAALTVHSGTLAGFLLHFRFGYNL